MVDVILELNSSNRSDCLTMRLEQRSEQTACLGPQMVRSMVGGTPIKRDLSLSLSLSLRFSLGELQLFCLFSPLSISLVSTFNP